MIRRSKGSHLVTISGVISEESLNFLSNFAWSKMRPFVNKLFKHAHRTRNGEFSAICQSGSVPHKSCPYPLHLPEHVSRSTAPIRRLVGLRRFSEGSISEISRCPSQKRTQICFANAANRVDIRAAAIVFCHVAAQTLIHISSSQYQQPSVLASHPRQKLC